MSELRRPPGPREWEGDATTTGISTDSNVDRLELLIVGRNSVVRHPLGEIERLRIGRSKLADIRVDDHSISRQHAILYLDARESRETPLVEIEDVGSSNGTRVRGQPLTTGRRTEIEVGEVVDLGKTMLIVQSQAPTERPRRLWTHGYFEIRLDEECARAKHSGGRFAVVRVAATGDDDAVRVEERLAAVLRSFDLVASYAPREYEVLLVDLDEQRTKEWVASFRNKLGAIGARVGAGCYPRDGRDGDALLSHAGLAVHGERRDSSPPPTGSPFEDGGLEPVARIVERVAPADLSVLILGETGAGKEITAEEIHRRSRRAQKPFLRLNCAALSETLLESELFGHERGAFTGAIGTKPGLLETANGGTVLLDEVGDLPLSTQAKLLRVIEDQKVLRVGSVTPREIDVRFLSATNRDLEADIVAGRFRSDLFYRLSGITLMIPPLRERPEAIARLARIFATRARAGATITESAEHMLVGYYWPGNVRELRNVIERAVLLAGPAPIRPEHLPAEKLTGSYLGSQRRGRPKTPPATLRAHTPLSENITVDPDHDDRRETLVGDLRHELGSLERDRIMDALEKCAGNQTQAARVLGISRRTLLYKLDQHDIPRPRKTAPKE